MGRLPTRFAGRDISWRAPYVMPGELLLTTGQTGVVFPEATFLHNIDKPFEIHRMVIRLTAFASQVLAPGPAAEIMETQPDTLDRRIRLRVTDLSKNENLTKSATLVSLLLAQNTGFWDWEEPYTIVRSEGFQVQVDVSSLPTICFPDPSDDCVVKALAALGIRVEISFQGFLVVVAPPSETR